MGTDMEKKIVIDGRGRLWLFYPLYPGNLGYAVRQGRDDVMEDQLNIGERVEGFDIDIDSRDNIHMAALSSGNKIVYLRYNPQGWKKYILYDFSKTSNMVSNMRISSGGEDLHLLYLLSSRAGDSAIVHHHWSGREWNGYKVMDIPRMEEGPSYDMILGRGGIPCLAVALNDILSLWSFEDGQWKTIVQGFAGSFRRIRDIILQEGYITFRDDRGIYLTKDIQRLNAEPPMDIVLSGDIQKGPVAVNRKQILYVAWVEGKRLYYRASYDGGASWGRAKPYHYVQGEELEVYGFSSNYSSLGKTGRIIATRPGNLHIPFVHRPMERIRFREEGEVIADNTKQGETLHHPEGGAVADADPLQRDGYIADDVSKAGNGKPAEELAGFRQEINKNMEEIRAELAELRGILNGDIRNRVEGLVSEVEEMKKRMEGKGWKAPATVKSTGNVITQEMINRYLNKGR